MQKVTFLNFEKIVKYVFSNTGHQMSQTVPDFAAARDDRSGARHLTGSMMPSFTQPTVTKHWRNRIRIKSASIWQRTIKHRIWLSSYFSDTHQNQNKTRMALSRAYTSSKGRWCRKNCYH